MSGDIAFKNKKGQVYTLDRGRILDIIPSMKKEAEIYNPLRNSGYSARGNISAPSSDIIPKSKYISTQNADMDKLTEIQG